jgi:O-antigen/teichoic acid export membrane protein
VHTGEINDAEAAQSPTPPAMSDSPPIPPDVGRHFSTAHLLNNLRGRTISSGVVTTASQAVQFLLTLGSTMVLARLLQPQDFGLVAMVVTVLGFLKIFKDAGLSTATVQREGITHAQVSNLFWINVALSGGISLLMVACAPGIAWFYHEPRLVRITMVLAGGFVLEGSAVQHMALLNRQMRFKTIAFIQIWALLASVTVGVVMAVLKCGYWSLAGAQLARPLVLCLLTWSASRWRPQRFAARSGTRPLLHFGANLTVSSLVWSFARGSDSLLIGRFYGADSLGLYTRAASLLSRPMDQALAPISAVFVPVLSRLQTEPERYRRTFLQVYEAMALIGFLSTGLVFAQSRPLMLVVLGSKWEGAAVIFAGFTISVLFYPFCAVSSWLFTSQDRGGDFFRSTFIISTVAVLSFAVGLPWGAAGMAIAYSCAGVLILLPVMFHMAGKSGPVKTSDLWSGFLRQLPVWAVVCAATFAARTLVTASRPITQLLVCTPLGLLAGVAFVISYPPARRVALNLLGIVRLLKKGRGVSSI